MARGDFAEQLFELVHGQKDLLLDLIIDFERIAKLIDDEQEAMEASDLDRIEELASEKLKIGQDVEIHCQQLQNQTNQVFALLGVSLNPGARTMRTCLSHLREYIDKKLNTSDEWLNLDKEISECEAVFSRLHHLKEINQKKIELNKLCLAKLLTHRQENYRFWQEVASDMMSAYDGKGKQQARSRQSILNVKA